MAEWLLFALSFQFYNFYKYTVSSAFFINLVGVSNRELEEFLSNPALPVRRVFRYNRILELPVLPVINKDQHFSDPNGQKFGNSHNPELFHILKVRVFNSQAGGWFWEDLKIIFFAYYKFQAIAYFSFFIHNIM